MARRKNAESGTNEYYEVEKLTHSIPYLIPSAARLLEDIGHNFQDSLRNLNASIYKVKVTSVTRTVDDVKNLKKRNTNSSQNSAHRYGTTFDVSWARYGLARFETGRALLCQARTQARLFPYNRPGKEIGRTQRLTGWILCFS